jgi:hypothetical protein
MSKSHAFDGTILASRKVIRIFGMMRGGEFAPICPAASSSNGTVFRSEAPVRYSMAIQPAIRRDWFAGTTPEV